MISLDQALANYEQIPTLAAELLPTAEALHRVLALDVCAAWHLPRYSQSALDGYVLCAEDAHIGVRLRISHTIAAGNTTSLPLLIQGEAQRIFTGARVPPNATASNAVVIAQERTEVVDGDLLLGVAVQPGANIRWQGEEAASGSTIAARGQTITPGLMASLISAGIATISVYGLPRVSVLVSGDELKSAGSALADGQIWDSNGPLVLAWLKSQGLSASLKHLPDGLVDTRQALAEALSKSDLVITTGGVSVGDRDYILAAAEGLGVQRVHWQVAQKPGKPLYFGRLGIVPLLGLPGNPGAVLVGLALHARKLLDVLQAREPSGAQFASAVLNEGIKSDENRVRLARMRLSYSELGQAMLEPLPYQDSHMLTNLDSATVLVRVPAGGTMLAAGDPLPWTTL